MALVRVLWATLLLSVASPVCAQDEDIAETREELISQIVTGGTNESEEYRHAVEVSECQLTTYRWKKQEDGSWVLWTSFRIPMLQVDFLEDPNTPDQHFLKRDDAREGQNMSLILLQPKGDFRIPHEKPFVREQPDGDFVLSDRGDGASFFVEYKRSVFISHIGADVYAKAEMFTKGYLRYRKKFCTFVG